MSKLEKLRRIFDSDATYQKRDQSDLMGNAPWIGNYDRTDIPKDMHGGVTEDAQKTNRRNKRRLLSFSGWSCG